MSDEKHPFDDFEYVVTREDKETESIDAKSKVRGLFQRIEEAASKSQDLACNQTVTFAGMICPIVCETDDKIEILHGHTKLWIEKDAASKALSARRKESREKWMHIYVNPSPPAKEE